MAPRRDGLANMLDNEIVVRVGGAAGDGVSSTGENLARSFARSGYHVHAFSSYQSVIRGGHTWYNIRAADQRVPSLGDGIDLLLALDTQTATLHAPDVRPGGAIVLDEGVEETLETQEDVQVLRLPLVATGKKYMNHPLMRNTVATGVASRLVGLDQDLLETGLEELFGAKGEETLEKNLSAFRDGRELAEQGEVIGDYPDQGTKRPLVLGNTAIALGALAAGCRFYAAYPMTPASGILHYLAQVGADNGMVVKQAEDELAVVNMTIGAGFAGARAMCGTSGGGFALMTEALGMAGMAEVGIVCVESQRAGPSTGLPTKTEQADLNQMIGASQGDYPKVILAPSDVKDAFQATVEAHDIAERYQLPVILASDFYLSEHMVTMELEDFPETVAIDRGKIASGNGQGGTDSQGREVASGKFPRYDASAEDGVSPRGIPGTPDTVFVAGTDEHDAHGNLVSDWFAGLPRALEVRQEQMDKRMRKLEAVLDELPAPELEGPEDAEATIVSWGSTRDVIREARERLAGQGLATAHLHIKYIQPFHGETVGDLLEGRRLVVVEHSHSGQFERFLRAETGLSADGRVRDASGEPFTPGGLADRLQEVIASL